MSAPDDTPDERTPLLHHVPTPQSPAPTPPEPPKPRISVPRATACLSALGVLIMLQATNISILTVTSSAIASDLDAFESSSWFTSAYLIAMSSAAPINGRLAQVLTPRISLAISTVLLAAGSVVTSFARSFAWFVVGRAITGAGGAGMFTIAVIVVLDVARPEQRGLLIGVLNTLMTIGVSVGATVAGALLPHTGWRMLFWLQAPVAVGFGAVLWVVVPGELARGRERSDESMLKGLARQDFVGALTLTLAIVLMLLAVSSPTSIPVWPIVVSLIIFVIFVVVELRFAREPIIPITLLKSRGLLFTCLATVGYMMSRWTILFYTPIYAIAVRGWSPATGGAILIPTNLGFAIGGLLAGWLHIRSHGSFYWSSILTYSIFPVTLLALALTVSATSSPVLLIIIVFANGFVTGAALNYTFAHVLYLTPKSTHYMVTSVMATFRGFAGSFASAAGGGYFVRMLRESLTTQFADHHVQPREGLVRKLLGSPALVQQLSGVERHAAVEGYNGALKALWLGAAVFAFVFALLQAGTGWKAPPEAEAEEQSAQG